MHSTARRLQAYLAALESESDRLNQLVEATNRADAEAYARVVARRNAVLAFDLSAIRRRSLLAQALRLHHTTHHTGSSYPSSDGSSTGSSGSIGSSGLGMGGTADAAMREYIRLLGAYVDEATAYTRLTDEVDSVRARVEAHNAVYTQ